MPDGKGRWLWALAGAAVAGVLVLLAVTAVPLRGAHGLEDSANIAQLTALLIAAGTAVVGVVAGAWRATRRVRTPPTRDMEVLAKEVLAGQVAQQWADEARHRGLEDPDPIAVRWRTPVSGTDSATLMDHPGNIQSPNPADGGVRWMVSSANVADLAHRFRDTRRRRLVILGGPGTGKTTLAIQLLLKLIATRTSDEPIPLLVPVAGWNTQRFPRLHDWLADKLARDYPALRSPSLGSDVTKLLTARGHILPVLDGLDELSVSVQVDVVTAINRSLGANDQLILTCRTAEFKEAVGLAGDVITSAAVLEPLPLSPTAAADYLASCIAPAHMPAWHCVLDELRHTPLSDRDGSSPAAPLAKVAETPLGLWLLRAIYTVPGSDPGELVSPGRFPSSIELRNHLFDRLIPALIAAREPSLDPADPFRPRRHHDPVDVRQWLGYLADRLLHPQADAADASGTLDLAWWQLAAITGAITRSAQFAFAILIGLLFALTFTVAFSLTPGFAASGTGLIVAPPMGLAVGLAAWPMTWFRPRSWIQDLPGYANLRIRGRWGELIRELALGAAIGLLVVLMFAGILGFVVNVKTGLVAMIVGYLGFGLPVGATLGFVNWAATPATSQRVTTPTDTWRADRTLNVLRIGTVTPVSGLAGALVGSAIGLAARQALHAVNALQVGIVLGAAVGLAIGCAVGVDHTRHRAWTVYLIATWRLSLAGLLPRRLLPFLDDCHRLGLLRAVGPIYQLRHAELHNHLASAYAADHPRPDEHGRRRVLAAMRVTRRRGRPKS